MTDEESDLDRTLRLPDELFGSVASSDGPRSTRRLDPVLPAWLFADAPRAGRGSELEAQLPAVGTRVDKFRLDALLGVGGFAAVFRATHLLLGTTVALKLLRPDVALRRAGLAEALCNEARFAARIDHPNVVRVYDVTHTSELTYVVMEYIAGESLEQAIRRHGALPLRRVLEIGLDVAAGLRAGLERQLLHRDVKPRNIIVTPEGLAKLIDLGLAHSHLDAVSLPGAQSGRGRRIVGTHGYLAPEWVLEPSAVDFRADVYSLGVTLYYAATGRLPFSTTDPEACLKAHCERPVPSPRSFRSDLPEAFARLLGRMLEKRPALRHESYDVLQAELRAISEGIQPPSGSAVADQRAALEARP